MKKILFILSVGLLLGTQLLGKVNLSKPYIWSYSDGKGYIKLFWLPNKTWSRGGWRLEKIQNGKTTLLADNIFPAKDKNALSKLSTKDIKQIEKFAVQIKSGAMKGNRANLAKFVFGSYAATNRNYGKALGLRYDDNSKTKGSRIYKLSTLDKNGKIIAWSKSKTVNPYKKSPLPPSVTNVKATVVLDGVSLLWKKPKLDKKNPVVGYSIERIDPDGSLESLKDKTLVVADNVFKNKVAIITDINAPLEKNVIYKVFSVGFFANRGKPKSIKVFVEDLSALMPPDKITIKGEKESVKLEWSENQSPYCAGYLLERSYLSKGPYIAVTPKGLKQSKTKYTDKNLKGGTAYYYRLRAINVRGKVGSPSHARMAVPTSKSKPPVITDLKADVGVSEIKLKWKKPKIDVAGYLVFRRPKGTKKWSQLNNYVVPDEFYEDSYSASTYGSFDYRIVTIGNDTKQSKPSKPIHVELKDSISPNPPYITNIDPNNGQVKISFKAAPPYGDINYFLLIRSVSPDDAGLVIGDKIPASKHQIVDKFVKYGQRYWYRLVAVDKSGNRSSFSQSRTVVAQNPSIPTPLKPILSYKSQPVPHVLIKIASVPKRMVAIIEKKQNNRWRYVANISDTATIADLKINSNAKLLYRVIYRAENGVQGAASKSSTIEIK
ncbi:MAG: fibronectin type III domain-containing protein [Sulfurospirillum sp.]